VARHILGSFNFKPLENQQRRDTKQRGREQSKPERVEEVGQEERKGGKGGGGKGYSKQRAAHWNI